MPVVKYRDPATGTWIALPELNGQEGPVGPPGPASTVAGPAGPVGPTGGFGPPGPVGATGAAGADGMIGYAKPAAAAPTPLAVGDMWVDTDDTLLTWDTDWIPLTLINGWVNYSGGTTVYGIAKYRRLIDDMVTIQGLVQNGSGTIAVMPTELWPKSSCIFTGIASPNVGARWDVRSTGEIVPSITAPGTNGFLSICATYHVGA